MRLQRRLLTAEFFDREYAQAGKTLTQIAEQTGLPRTMLAEYARAAGIRVVNATERDPAPIDPAWLRHQYVTLGRSFTDIGTELGLSEMTVNRAAHRFDIPIRAAGVTSHPQMITRLDLRFPLDIRRAVEGVRHGWLRLRRFQQAMAHPSLNTAAAHLSVHNSVLVLQIQRLEADIGAPLLHRAALAQPMHPTERGTALLEALTEPHLKALLDQHAKPLPGWKPDDRRRTTPAAPTKTPATNSSPRQERHADQPPAPQPIRPARQHPTTQHAAARQNSSRQARLHRFATAMTYPTLTEAADAIGVNISTLIEQLNRLEHDVGEPLFHRATPDGHTQRPTRRGAALLRTLARTNTQATGVAPSNTTETATTTSAALDQLPRDLLRAVRGQRSGWTRLERFAVTMAHPTVTEAATALGIERTTLLEQLHHLETHVGAALYHRATAQGQAHRATPRGAKLLTILARPDIQELHAARARLPRIP
jgi:DNA-binding transcriptional LysR family regulator